MSSMADGIDLDGIKGVSGKGNLSINRKLVASLVAEVERLRADNEALRQAAWDSMGLFGFDRDGDKEPHGVTSKDLAKWLVESAKEIRDDLDEVTNEAEDYAAEVVAVRAERDALQARIQRALAECDLAVEQNRPPHATNSEVLWLVGDVRAALAAPTKETDE